MFLEVTSSFEKNRTVAVSLVTFCAFKFIYLRLYILVLNYMYQCIYLYALPY